MNELRGCEDFVHITAIPGTDYILRTDCTKLVEWLKTKPNGRVTMKPNGTFIFEWGKRPKATYFGITQKTIDDLEQKGGVKE